MTMSAITKALMKCKELSYGQRTELFVDSFQTVWDVKKRTLSDEKALNDTIKIVLYSVAADDRFNREEFKLVAFLLNKATGKMYTYSSAKDEIEKRTTISQDEQIGYLRSSYEECLRYGEEMGAKFICLVLSTLSIDDEITFKERMWTKKVFDIPAE